VVEAVDIRPTAEDEVQSLGAVHVGVALEETATLEAHTRGVSQAANKHEREVLMEHVRRSVVVITKAQVPGNGAPLLMAVDMVEAVSSGLMIVRRAGGSCAL
jgi:NAD(P) transhydrogenase subunit alpha